MISTATGHTFAEKKTKNLFSMRPAWLKKDSAATGSANSLSSSPDSPKIKELALSVHRKSKALSPQRGRELLTVTVI
ncbi:hypothetical protein LPJ66_007894, partial [Kickxella alabastrina]